MKDVLSHTVSYPEDNQQSTNKNMCNGENSDPRDHCLRYCHFEVKTSPDGGNLIMNICSYTSKLMKLNPLTADQLMDRQIYKLRDCIMDLRNWKINDRLLLNDDKTCRDSHNSHFKVTVYFNSSIARYTVTITILRLHCMICTIHMSIIRLRQVD